MLKALKLRLPEDASDALQELGAETLAVYMETMRRPSRWAQAKLAAARDIREEMCKPRETRVTVGAADGHAAMLFSVGPPVQARGRTPEIAAPGAGSTSSATTPLLPTISPKDPQENSPEIPKKIATPVAPIRRKAVKKP